MKFTLALQNEMKAIINKDGNIEIDIPDACHRDLWDAQIQYWLEENDSIKDRGFLRVIKKRIKFVKDNKFK